MITLKISRTGLTPSLVPITVNDAGSGDFTLVSFAPGARQRDNAYAQSRWLDGGQLVSTRTDIVTMDLVVQVRAASYRALVNAAGVLDDALNQFTYTITETLTGAVESTVYTCMPANTSFAYDPILMRSRMGLFTASIPRQP